MNFVEPRKTASDHPVWIDLGCGVSKQPGFIGIDRFALPGVDIVCDLDRGIPLPSDSADYLLASHALEHLRDLPAAIAEIHRVCKDRAVVTIIAPYDATRLNQANPYHLNAWNEHTARFFTADDAPTIDAAEYRFPAAEHWGLQASDYTRSDVALRCLRMEFSYLPPYRGLDEETKRTLRQSLSDVCDQMALHLLVVKSPVTAAELSARAAALQYPVTPAFEARRRDEADTGAQNLFSELAGTPSRIDALSASTTREIALLGEDVRRFLQRSDHFDKALIEQTAVSEHLAKRVDHIDAASVRLAKRVDHIDAASERLAKRVDHIDRALVAESQALRNTLAELSDAGRAMAERITAVNGALTRRMLALGDEVRATATAELHAAAEQRTAQARAGEQILHYFVAERRARADRSFWVLRALRRYRQRGVDLRAMLGGEFPWLWQGPETPQQADFRLQAGTFFNAGVPRSYPLQTTGSLLHGIAIGVLAALPPVAPAAIADFELADSAGTVLAAGSAGIDASCGSGPVTIGFAPVPCTPDQPLMLKLTPLADVERIGVQLLEWHRVTRAFRRVPEQRLAWRGLYAA